MNRIGFCNKVNEEKTLLKSRLEETYDPHSTIFGKNTFLPINQNEALNDNVLVLGGSGTGKTYSFVEPNILQANSNYVIADAKGDILNNIGYSLKEKGYNIKVLNLIDLKKSMTYNPLVNMNDEMSVISFANQLMKGAISDKEGMYGNDPFWTNGPATIIESLILFVKEFLPAQEQTMGAVTRLFRMLDRTDTNINSILRSLNSSNDAPEMKFTHPQTEDFNGNKVDVTVTMGERLFQYAEEKDPSSIALRMWNSIWGAKSSEKTWASLLAIAGAALAPYSVSEIDSLLSANQLAFDTLLNPKTALFILYDDADSSKNFIFNIFIKQLFSYLYKTAFKQPNKRLPIKVRFFLDDFKNLEVPKFEDYLATARSRNISICMMMQDESQLRAKFGETAPSVIGNCSSYLLTGTMDLMMAQDASERFSRTPQAIREMSSDKFLLDVGGKICSTIRYDYHSHPNYIEGKYDPATLKTSRIAEGQKWNSFLDILKNLPGEYTVDSKVDDDWDLDLDDTIFGDDDDDNDFPHLINLDIDPDDLFSTDGDTSKNDE